MILLVTGWGYSRVNKGSFTVPECVATGLVRVDKGAPGLIKKGFKLGLRGMKIGGSNGLKKLRFRTVNPL